MEFDWHTDLEFGNPDWLKLAAAFDWNGHRVERCVDLRDVLEAAFEEDGPSLVTLPIDYRENLKLTERLGELTQPGVIT
jgi:acetolactate synthase-1/2/3 large subunit